MNQFLRAFLWGYGKRLGNTAARKTAFLAVPVLLIIAYVALSQLGIVSLDTGGMGVHSLLEAFR